MMPPDPGLIAAPSAASLQMSMEPAHNAVNTMSVLASVEELSGIDDWVVRTANAMPPDLLQNNRIVMSGLGFSVIPDRKWPNFPSFIRFLETQEPESFRKRLFSAYAQLARKKNACKICMPPDPVDESIEMDYRPLLDSFDHFVNFLMKGFPAECLDLEVESESFRYLNDPPAMKRFVVDHFKTMWADILSADWEAGLPKLQATIDAFHQMELNKLSRLEAVQQVVGRELEEEWRDIIKAVGTIIFVPSVHLGPYLRKYRHQDTLRIMFGARIPEGIRFHAPELDRAQILVRINALADDTRLRILKLITDEGEKRSTEIMQILGLSQSAASRHLKQLAATGYLTERRCETAKSYRLNNKRLENTLGALKCFLSN
ncbi:MAG: winged helix-turn-helix transcriptional regulator [Desulfobacteraceae bacterium]|nr:winged helix-turn-helix transcriptional regulator [Desulfobacteraceae bacterium]